MTCATEHGKLPVANEAARALVEWHHFRRGVGYCRLPGLALGREREGLKVPIGCCWVPGNPPLVRVDRRNPQICGGVVIDRRREKNSGADFVVETSTRNANMGWWWLLNLITKELLHDPWPFAVALVFILERATQCRNANIRSEADVPSNVVVVVAHGVRTELI